MSESTKLAGYPDHETVCMAIGLARAAHHATTAEILGIMRDRLAIADATVAALTAENERMREAVKGLPRFECTMGGCGDPECCGSYPEMESDATGEWVRYTDIVAALPSSRETTDG